MICKKKRIKNMLFVLMVGLFINNGCAYDASKETVVVFETDYGLIEIKLYPEIAPKTCENFTTLVEGGYYNGTVFHEVIRGFMAKGGDPTGTGRGGKNIWDPGVLPDEVNKAIRFDRLGLVAMASDGRNMNRSQFFIATSGLPWLNGHNTIFGEVVSGYDAVQKIENVNTDYCDRPIIDQRIIKAYVKNVE